MEYAPGGAIASASTSERRWASMPRTNDDNEGRLGGWRRRSHHAPSMTLEQHNAREMYKKNGTAAFIRSCLGPEDLKWLRGKAREEDSSGMVRKRREIQAQAHHDSIEKKRKSDEENRAKKDAKRVRIDAVTPRLDAASIRENPGRNEELDLQLDWHRRHDKAIPAKGDCTLKKQKIEALIEAVERYNAKLSAAGVSHNADSPMHNDFDPETDSDI